MNKIARALFRPISYLNSHRLKPDPNDPQGLRTDPARWVPYMITHGGCLGVIWFGWSWTAVGVAVALYFFRMFAITGFYHRYFSHRTFRTSRLGQFIFGVWGNLAAQRGPLWWAAQHRKHHKHSDEPEDAHSPVQHGLYWSHFGWLTARSNMAIDLRMVPDLAKYPELMFIDKYDFIVPVLLGVAMYGLGATLESVAPELGTNGWQMLTWGFFISTVVLFHGTCLVNSVTHMFGRRRFKTKDDSRNNALVAAFTLGEGWHNNHHHYPATARQGFYWWEIDITYYILKLMSLCGIIWDLRPVPARILAEGRSRKVKTQSDSSGIIASHPIIGPTEQMAS